MHPEKPLNNFFAPSENACSGLIINHGLRAPQEESICDETRAHLLLMPEERCEAEFRWRAPDGAAKALWLDGRRVVFAPKNAPYKILWKKTAAFVRMTMDDAFLANDAAIQKNLASVQIRHESQLSSRDSLVRQLFKQFEARCLNAAFPGTNRYINAAGHMFAVHALKIFEAGETASRSGLPIPGLRRVQAYVEQNLSEKIYVEDMAREANLRPHHFTELFTVSTGMTPHHYLLTTRVERAQKLLREGKSNAADVAATVGFCDESYMWNALRKFSGGRKQEAGKSPVKHRKSQFKRRKSGHTGATL